MKLFFFLITFIVVGFSNTVISQAENAIRPTTIYNGLRIANNKDTIIVPIGGYISVKTPTNNYRGTLDSLGTNKFFIGAEAIQISEVLILKYIPSKKRKIGLGFLLSAPSSFVVGLGFGFWYLGSGGEWTNHTGIVFAAYAPMGLLTGTILLNKKKLKMDKGWDIAIISS